MKQLLALMLAVLFAAAGLAHAEGYGSRPYRDAYGNAYSNPSNLYKDIDRDGRIGMYDYNDRNRNVQTPYDRSNASPYGLGESRRNSNRRPRW